MKSWKCYSMISGTPLLRRRPEYSREASEDGQRSVHDCGSSSCWISPPRDDGREGCGSVGHVRVQRGSLSETRAKREGGARGNRTAETWHRCNAGSGETDGNGQRTPN